MKIEGKKQSWLDKKGDALWNWVNRKRKIDFGFISLEFNPFVMVSLSIMAGFFVLVAWGYITIVNLQTTIQMKDDAIAEKDRQYEMLEGLSEGKELVTKMRDVIERKNMVEK